MTIEEAEEFLFFMRDEMLKRFEYDAQLVWRLPALALEDPNMSNLVYRWFYATKPDIRKYVEGRMLKRAEEILCL